jgi:hypothetical protein
MLNGAAMKLRNAQARIATASTNRSSEPTLSFFFIFALLASGRARAGGRAAITRLFPAQHVWSSGMVKGLPRIMCGANAAPSDQAAR